MARTPTEADDDAQTRRIESEEYGKIAAGDTVTVEYKKSGHNSANTLTKTGEVVHVTDAERSFSLEYESEPHRGVWVGQLYVKSTKGNQKRMGLVEAVYLHESSDDEDASEDDVHPDYRSGSRLAGELKDRYDYVNDGGGSGDRFRINLSKTFTPSELFDDAAKHGFRVHSASNKVILFRRIDNHPTDPRTDA
jgi:hypothetical protein